MTDSISDQFAKVNVGDEIEVVYRGVVNHKTSDGECLLLEDGDFYGVASTHNVISIRVLRPAVPATILGGEL